jgi:hypothetical protein
MDAMDNKSFDFFRCFTTFKGVKSIKFYNMSQIKYFIFLILTALIMLGCKNQQSDSKLSAEDDTTATIDETVVKARSIFYRMYLPSEMYKIFEKAGAVYTPDILNPVENVNLYETSTKAALNLGIYGVDLSYNKMFGQNQKTLLYFTVIHKLSQQLGIPDNMFTSALKKMEKNITNRDSLTVYATDIYSSANRFLNENDRESTAALIITGGWIESLYVAAKIADDNVDNQEILERIAFQKYSLKSLLALLANYQAEPAITKYVLMLKSLNRAFDKLEIYYHSNDLNIDTVNKLITANKIDIDLPKETIKEIKAMITQIRTEIVN